MKVFLGGTCNETKWRNKLIPMLNIDYFNPVVEDQTIECKEELRQRKICDINLYVITPKFKGFYSVAEVVEDSCKCPDKTILTILDNDEGQVFIDENRSANALADLVARNGVKVFYSLKETADYLNTLNNGEENGNQIFTKEELENNLEFNEVYEEIKDKLRWTIIYYTIFKASDDDKFYSVNWQRGSTEYQDKGREFFENSSGLIECKEVHQVEKKVLVLEEVK